MSSVALEQFVCIPRPPAPRGIIGEIARRQRLPNVERWTDHTPARLDHIGALKHRSVPDHAIVKQTLITSTGLSAEIISVLEIHVHCTQPHDRTWNYRCELQRNSLLGLDMKDELVGQEVLDWCIPEQNKGRAPELNHDLCALRSETLASPQIERNVGPSPVINCQFHGYERLSSRVWRDILFLAIARYALRILNARAILTSNRLRQHFLRT